MASTSLLIYEIGAADGDCSARRDALGPTGSRRYSKRSGLPSLCSSRIRICNSVLGFAFPSFRASIKVRSPCLQAVLSMLLASPHSLRNRLGIVLHAGFLPKVAHNLVSSGKRTGAHISCTGIAEVEQ